VRSEERLPPGQHLTPGFPVLDLGVRPEISLGEWRLEIGGLVEHPQTLHLGTIQRASTILKT
jgi:DMSO/TMAO reductase YedYZ molybdopterin-dependent catalytic subunit